MASVVVYNKEYVDAILEGVIVSAAITGGNLIFTLGDGSTINVGGIVSGVPDANLTTKGVVELASDTETIAGTDSARAVTPLSLAALTATDSRKGLVELATDAEALVGTDNTRAVTATGLKAVADTRQPIDPDLTTIASLASTSTNFIQAASGTWASRTPAQARDTLGAVGMPVSYYSTGSGYNQITGPGIYVGPTDPGSVANGSLWFDTTGA